MNIFKSFILCLVLVLLTGQICFAKDLYVSLSGSDSVSYEANDINHPWQSVAKAWADARTDDVVYYRAGDYTITSKINVADGGHNVTHTNYNNETVSWSSTLSDTTIEVGAPNTVIDGINVNSAASGGDRGFFRLGWNVNQSSPSGFVLRNCIGRTSAAGSNTGIVHMRARNGEYAEGAIIENCRFIGPGGEVGIANSTAIITFHSKNWTIQNCEISGFYTGLYLNKHPNDKSERDSVVRNNFIHDCHNAMLTKTNYTLFSNNIFDGTVRMGYDPGPTEGGDIGSDYNMFIHNTFTGTVDLMNATRDGDPYPGAQHNTFNNNIFLTRVDVFAWAASSFGPHNTSGNYNLYSPSPAILSYQSFHTLSSWQRENSSDANAIDEVPSFVGGSNPDTIEGFALTATSPGKNAASDGKDMGADVTLIGVDNGSGETGETGGEPSNTAPDTPGVSFVELKNEVPLSASIIFRDDFESTTEMSSRYYGYNSSDGDCVVEDGSGLGSSRGIRTHWEASQIDAGGFWYMFGRNPVASLSNSTQDYRDVYWRFYLKTSVGWTGGNPAKLTRAVSFAGADWSQAMIAHVWGNIGEDVLKTDPVSLVADGQVQSSGYNDFEAMRWLGAGVGTTPLYSTERSGQWHLVEVHVRLNTSGQSDGVFEVWVDGNLERQQDNLNFVGTWQEYGINAIAFGNYWNEGAPAAQDRYMDNVVISTAPIGPALSPVNPAILKTSFSDSDSGDTQSAFEVQICTSADGSGTVWSGVSNSSTGNSITVSSATGSFQGVLAGQTALTTGTTFYARVRQADSQGEYSGWSATKIFKTESAGGGTSLEVPGTPTDLDITEQQQ